MRLASMGVDCWARSWFMVEDGFKVRIFRFKWGLFTIGDTEGHGGIWGVISGTELAVGWAGRPPLAPKEAELRSAGQPRAAVPT